MESQSSGLAASREQTVGAADRVTVYGWKALAGSTIGYSMDGFDLMIVSFMLTAISADLALTSTQAGSLITWTLMGAVAGGLIFGSMSDHFGRIRILTWTILIFAVFTGLCGLARGYWDLAAYRTFAGLGLGGEFGIGMALAAEAWPASKRARVSCYVALGWQAGVLLAAFVTPVLLPVVGWRGMFLLGLLPAVVAFIVRRALDEPEIFVKKHAAKKENSFRLLVKDRKTRRTTLGIAILCSVQIFGYYGIMIWMPLSRQEPRPQSHQIWHVDFGDSSRHGVRRVDVWPTRRPRRPQTDLHPVSNRRHALGLPVFASYGPEHDSLGGSNHGYLCEWDVTWHWGAHVRSVSHSSACDCAECIVQFWPGCWWYGTAGRRRPSCEILV